MALLFPCAQLFRKMLLVYILVFQNNYPVYSLFCVLLQSIIMIIVIGLVEPMTLRSENRWQLFNEVFILFFADFLFPLTESNSDLDGRDLVGKSLIVIFLLNLGANISLNVS